MSTYSSELNVTPLIDVLLVLVVMLIITVPIATHAVHLELPIGKPRALPERPIVDVEIDFDGQVFWNGQNAGSDGQLERWFRSAAGAQPEPIINVRPESRTRYERVAQVLAAAQRAHVRSIGLKPVE